MERWEKNCIKLIHKFFWNCSKFIKQNKYSFYRISIVTKAVEFCSTPFVFFTDTLTGKFICGRDPSYNHLLKSLRVAIATNQISLSFPHKDVSLRNWWYLSIPQFVLIIFGLGIVSNTSKKNGNGQVFHTESVAEVFSNGRIV